MPESQRGATHYRVNPNNRCVVQIQTGTGRAWYWHSEFTSPAKARTAVMRLSKPFTFEDAWHAFYPNAED